MLKVYLAPTLEREAAISRPGRVIMEQTAVVWDLSRTLPGWRRTFQNIKKVAGVMRPVTLLAVEADDFSALDADPRVWEFSAGARLREALADPVEYVLPVAVRNRLTQLEITGLTRATKRQLWDLVRDKIEPALHEQSYELVARPEPRGSITDAFTGTGALGAGWAEGHHIFGSLDVARVSDVAQLALGSGDQAMQFYRSEATFPNTQWAQMRMLYQNDASIRVAAVARGQQADTTHVTGYWSYYQLDGTNFDFRVVNFPSTLTSLASGAHGGSVTNGNYNLGKVDSNGTTHTLYLDSVQIANPTDSTFSSGHPAIIGFSSNTIAGTGDDFECIDAVGGAAFGDVRSHVRGSARGMHLRATRHHR